MCVGTCARTLGPVLLILGLLSIIANLFLLFPSWKSHYLNMGQIAKRAMVMPGLWGGGLLVFPAAIQITSIGWNWSCCSSSGNCQKMFLSIVLSGLALLGSAACFIISGVGLTEGPFCLYVFTTSQGKRKEWGYPFIDTGAKNYLYDPSLWKSVCIEPQNIVAWNVYFFSALLIISVVEMILAALLILNSCFGCFCGFSKKK
ncbi:transmembrane 4 L6 family member 19 [Anolis carolinensis]|uniref:Transmembrane 4 L six family member 19 n=1 Tax=Anolis carolinensis TaxID=28377 RepID=G1K8H5_ANOCA|nr:PREDICTED: transmembrane 4 L6 family member 19 [Anolis carolinensis]|eukprot:XP_008104548.1 PREDICTED: transmembrane 4 L6 family member 19 [Anolis carolinensis]